MRLLMEVVSMGISEGWQMDVQQRFAVDIYKEMWDGCRVHENDAYAKGEETAQLLDFGDVDKIIIHPDSRQVHMAQRFRKPYGRNNQDPDFTLRYSRPCSDEIIEYERLMTAYESEQASYPSRYSFGRVNNDHTQGLYELFIFDTDSLIEGIKSGEITENGPRKTYEGQEFMWYDTAEIEEYGAVSKYWQPDPDQKTDRPRQSAVGEYFGEIND
jgi:hypothetical protein